MTFTAPLSLNLVYLTSFGVLGVYLPYFNIYLTTLGLGGLQIGIVSALLPLCGAIVPTAGGLLADRLGLRREIIVVSSLLALGAFALVPAVRGFAGVALVIGVFAAVRAPALPLVEATAMEISEGGGPPYGRMRSWGSVAFIGMALATGGAMGARGAGTILPIVLALLALNVASTLLLPRGPGRLPGRGRLSALAGLLRRPRVLLFLAACVLSQVAHGPYYVFYSIHLKDSGYTPEAIGLLWGIAVACEVAALLRMPAILSRLGTLPTMAIGLLLSALRWWICAVTVAPWPMAAAQALYAATYAAFHVAAVTHTHRLFGQDRRASGQAIYNSATYGIGNALGMCLSGILYDRGGAAALFARASWVALLGGLLVLAAARAERRAGAGAAG